ncbi:hypothetical protein HOK021_51310 [Streptomyces hygroscopicus]|nr:hypothetical protein HOK021_51310 [Streptomyces hygroscopicus]
MPHGGYGTFRGVPQQLTADGLFPLMPARSSFLSKRYRQPLTILSRGCALCAPSAKNGEKREVRGGARQGSSAPAHSTAAAGVHMCTPAAAGGDDRP